MKIIEIIGLIAGALTTGAFVPQVYKLWKTKSTKDISMSMYIVMLIGVVLWFTYGFYHDSLPILLTNLVTAMLLLTVIVLKLKYK